MLDVGDKLPDFTLWLAKADGSRDPVPVSTFVGKSPLVLTFYPIAFSGVCTPHMCEMRDGIASLENLANATALGFSTDPVQVNIAFAKANGIPFGIYSDPNREVVDAIWGTTTTGGVKNTALRGWLVVNAEGTVVEKWVAENPGIWSGTAPIEAALSKL